LFSLNGFTWGVVASYGVFLGYYLENNTFPDARDIDFAFIGGLNFAMAMLFSPLITVLLPLSLQTVRTVCLTPYRRKHPKKQVSQKYWRW